MGYKKKEGKGEVGVGQWEVAETEMKINRGATMEH